MVMAPPPTCDSAILLCFHGCPAFLHRHFPRQSPPSHPLNLSLCSQQQPSPWDCSTIPKLQLPAAVPSRGPVSLSRVCMAAARTVWFSFHLGCHRSAVSLSALNVSPLTQTIALMWGSDPGFSSPTCRGFFVFFLFFPLVLSSYLGLHGSKYSFTLVRYTCPLSAGVHMYLCLKLYSWYIHGERCTPCPPTPPPSSLHELHLDKRVILSFESLKPDIDFSSLAMKVLNGIFFQYKTILSALNIYCFV